MNIVASVGDAKANAVFGSDDIESMWFVTSGITRATWITFSTSFPIGAHMTKSTIWISYDLGVRGDYESLYAWLDSHGAKECGDSLAILTYEYRGSLTERLRAELTKAFAVNKRTRIYVIHRDQKTDKNRGKFIFGGRRAPPWTGYSSAGAGAADEEA